MKPAPLLAALPLILLQGSDCGIVIVAAEPQRRLRALTRPKSGHLSEAQSGLTYSGSRPRSDVFLISVVDEQGQDVQTATLVISSE